MLGFLAELRVVNQRKKRMLTTIVILLFVIGLMVGSFLNVVIFRMDDLKSIVNTRSRCPHCKELIAWYDLIPFLSFVLLRAKCRYCGKSISWQYPVVEVATGFLFAFLAALFGASWALVFYSVVFSILAVVLVYDVRTQTVPEVFVWIALGLSAVLGWYFGGFTPWQAILGALIAGGFLATLVLVSKEKWMGAGDIKIGATLGFLCGYPNVIVGLFLAFVLGSIVGLVYIYISKKTLKASLPFAPFLIFATLVTVGFGSLIVNWYLARFLGY